MMNKSYRRIFWLVVLVSVSGTLSAQSPLLPSYTQASQRTALWTVLGVFGAGLTIYAFSRMLYPPEPDFDDGGSSDYGTGRMFLDFALFGAGIGLTSAAVHYGYENYRVMQSAPRSAPPTQEGQDSSDTSEADTHREAEPALGRLVERPYEEVRDAFDRGIITSDSTDTFGTSLIFRAARMNRDPSVYRLFLEHGTDPTVRDRHGRNLLFYMLDRENEREVAYLLARNVSPLQQNDDGKTALEHALQKEQWALLEPLIAHLLRSYTLRDMERIAAETLERGWQFILETPAAGAVAAELIRSGVPLTVPEAGYFARRGMSLSNGRDYLRKAIANRFPVPVILAFMELNYYDVRHVAMQNHPLLQMIEAGYSADEFARFLDHSNSLPARGEAGETVLHVLSERDAGEAAGLVAPLIGAGANVEARTRDGNTPLILAAENNHVEYARMLLHAGAQPNARGRYERTALHVAARRSSDGEMIDLLLQNGADSATLDDDGWQPLHVAAFWGNTVAAERLLDADAQIDALTPRGAQPYHFSRDPSTVQMFLSRGVEWDVTDGHGSTILHIAMSQYPSPELISHLLGLGLDPNQRNDDGNTPLFYATVFENTDPQVGLLLLEAGADPSIENENGLTPWDMIEINESLRNTDFYWALNDLRYCEP